MICKSIACQFITKEIVAMFEFSIENDQIVKISESHYNMVNAAEISPEELKTTTCIESKRTGTAPLFNYSDFVRISLDRTCSPRIHQPALYLVQNPIVLYNVGCF